MVTYKRRGWSAKNYSKSGATSGLQHNVTDKTPMGFTAKGVMLENTIILFV